MPNLQVKILIKIYKKTSSKKKPSSPQHTYTHTNTQYSVSLLSNKTRFKLSAVYCVLVGLFIYIHRT